MKIANVHDFHFEEQIFEWRTLAKIYIKYARIFVYKADYTNYQ